MKALDLYKFVETNELEYHWYDDDVILFVSHWLIPEWYKLLGSRIFDEEGIECNMKYGYFCFKIQSICNHFDIELAEVFKKDNES
jgi:hypothetical protein